MRALILATALALVAAAPAAADSFNHTGTFSVPANLRAGEPIGTVTSAEIVAAADDGRTLIYTDSPASGSASSTSAARTLPPPAARSTWAASRRASPPSATSRWSRSTPARASSRRAASSWSSTPASSGSCARASPRRPARLDRDLARQALRRDRDRERARRGRRRRRDPAGARRRPAGRRPAGASQLRSGAADRAWPRSRPSDPEPEFVDINRRNEAVVTLQENNHLAIVDLPSART